MIATADQRPVYHVSRNGNTNSFVLDETAVSEHGKVVAIREVCHFVSNRIMCFAVEEQEDVATGGYFLLCLGDIRAPCDKSISRLRIAGLGAFGDKPQIQLGDGPSLLVSSGNAINIYAFSPKWKLSLICSLQSLRTPLRDGSIINRSDALSCVSMDRVAGRSLCCLRSQHTSSLSPDQRYDDSWAWIDLRVLSTSWKLGSLQSHDGGSDSRSSGDSESAWVSAMPWWSPAPQQQQTQLTQRHGVSASGYCDEIKGDRGWEWAVRIGSGQAKEMKCTVPYCGNLSYNTTRNATATCIFEHQGRIHTILAIERIRDAAWSDGDAAKDVTLLVIGDDGGISASRQLPAYALSHTRSDRPAISSLAVVGRYAIVSIYAGTVVVMSLDNLEILAVVQDIAGYFISKNGPFASDLVLIPTQNGVNRPSLVELNARDTVSAIATQTLVEIEVISIRLDGTAIPRKSYARRIGSESCTYTNADADTGRNQIEMDHMADADEAIGQEVVAMGETSSRHRKKKHKSDRRDDKDNEGAAAEDGDDVGTVDRKKASKRRRKDKDKRREEESAAAAAAIGGASTMQTALMMKIDELASRCAKLRGILSDKKQSSQLLRYSIARSVASQMIGTPRGSYVKGKLTYLLPDASRFPMKPVFSKGMALEPMGNMIVSETSGDSHAVASSSTVTVVEVGAFSVQYLTNDKEGIVAYVDINNKSKETLFGLKLYCGSNFVESMAPIPAASNQQRCANTIRVQTRSGYCVALLPGKQSRLSCYIRYSAQSLSFGAQAGVALYVSFASCLDAVTRASTEDVIFSHKHRLGDIRMVSSAVAVGVVPILPYREGQRTSFSHLRLIHGSLIPIPLDTFSAIRGHTLLPSAAVVNNASCFSHLVVERFEIRPLDAVRMRGKIDISLSSLQNALSRGTGLRVTAMPSSDDIHAQLFDMAGLGQLSSSSARVFVSTSADDPRVISSDDVIIAAVDAPRLRVAAAELTRILEDVWGAELARSNSGRANKQESLRGVIKVLQRAAVALLVEADALALLWKSQNTWGWERQLASIRAGASSSSPSSSTRNAAAIVSSIGNINAFAPTTAVSTSLIRVGSRLCASPQQAHALLCAQLRSDLALGDAVRALESLHLGIL